MIVKLYINQSHVYSYHKLKTQNQWTGHVKFSLNES